MSRNVIECALLACTVGLMSGCGSAYVPETNPQPAQVENKANPQPEEKPKGPPKVFRLEAPIEISLADLLKKPRQELAQQAQELAEQIQLQEKNHREGIRPYVLLPEIRLPLAIPVFRQAKFYPDLKLSLPPYLSEGKKDNPIALHLARFGDGKAALKLIDPSDRGVGRQIKKLRSTHNYPVEWTRLVGLLLHAAQVGLASGELESGRQLLGLHKQLLQVLDARSRSGMLGATLLSRGRGVLAAAAAAWQKTGRPDLAEQARAALAAWGKVPPFPVPIKLGGPGAPVAALFGNSGEGHAWHAADHLRAFDLLALPFPEESAGSVLAIFDADSHLAQVLVTYRARVTEIYPQPANLAFLVEENGSPGQDHFIVGRLHQRSYRCGAYVWDVTLVPHNSAAGAVVRLETSKPLFTPVSLPRGFPPVSLDRSYKQNRRRFAVHQRGDNITVDDVKALTRLANPVPALRLAEATLARDPDQDIVNRYLLSYAPEQGGLPALAKMALPLWGKFGPAQIQGENDKTNRYLALVWEDDHTRITLRLPDERGQPSTLEMRDRSKPETLAKRAAQVAAGDRVERAARFKEKKLLTRIARALEGICLGMTRAAVLEVLPIGKGIVQRDIPDGLAIVYNGDPEENPGYIPRELFVRFGPNQRVAEVRARYIDASAKPHQAGLKKLLTSLSKQCGAPEELPGAWAKVWTAPFARRKPAPVMYRWQDDATLFTSQRDSEGLELSVRDCPLEQEAGVPLAQFRYLPAGPAGCKLGMKKADLLKAWHDAKPEFQQGLLILTPSKDSLYDQIFVTFNKGEAVLITARHKTKFDDSTTPTQLAAAVQQAWAADVHALGWPRREDMNRRKQIQSWTSHDDLTRLSIFWQERKSGSPQLFTEWKLLEAPKTR